MQALAGDDDDEAAPLVLALAERAFHRWLGDTCPTMPTRRSKAKGRRSRVAKKKCSRW
jgi:hypothetical protein